MNPRVDLVIKVGGSLARDDGLAHRLRPIEKLRSAHTLVVVPGGGPFADVVRAEYAAHGLSESAAHWMAILGMDQYAYVLADVLARAVIVRRPAEIAAALGEGRLPVLAPSEWMREEDPLPHAWSVTGDSIAAWVAGQLGARKLILLKSAADRAAVDRYFPSALPPGLECEIVAPDSAGWRRIA